MKCLRATVPRSLIDMFTADACVATEEQQLEARNCGTGQKLDFGAYVIIGVGMGVLGYFNWHDHISLAAL